MKAEEARVKRMEAAGELSRAVERMILAQANHARTIQALQLSCEHDLLERGHRGEPPEEIYTCVGCVKVVSDELPDPKEPED